MRLALFDFDGTIICKDSMVDFIIYTYNRPRYYWGLLLISPYLIAWKLKMISAGRAKSRLLRHFFGNWQVDRFNKIADDYARNRLDELVRPEARNRINWHHSRGDQVIIVSASIRNWLALWCEKQNIPLIATELVFDNGRITGELAGRNCQGQEKVNRIHQTLELDNFDYIYAYGDSNGDRAMLTLADEPYFKPFR